MIARPATVLLLAVAVRLCGYPNPAGAAESTAEFILSRTETRRGICLDLGCGDGQLAVEIARRTDFTVYCVDPDAKVIAQVRKTAGAAGLYGLRVVAQQGSLAKLAYPDHCASLVVCGEEFLASGRERDFKEMLRVLNPNGVAVIGQGAAAAARGPKLTRGQLEGWLRGAGIANFKIVEEKGLWAVFSKPRLASWDEWTHRNHDPANTFGSETPLAEPPYKLLWNSTCSPTLAAASVLLAGGREIIVGPEYKDRADITPSIHVLDAFTGIELWKKTGRKELPIDRRLEYYSQEKSSCDIVAVGDSLYVLGGKVCNIFDLRNGQLLKQLAVPAEAGVDDGDIWLWVAVIGDRLYGAVGSPPRHGRITWYGMFRRGASKAVFALNRETGRLLWVKKAPAFANSLAIGGGRLYLWDPKQVIHALDLKTGDELWTRPTGFKAETTVTLSTYYRNNLWVLCSSVGHYGLNEKELAVFSADKGEPLFSKPEGDFNKEKAFGACTFAGGRVYCYPQHGRGLDVVLDAETGKELGATRLAGGCTPQVATPNVLLGRLRGGPLGGGPGGLDLKTGKVFAFEGLRPTCWYPAIPAYGLLYVQAAGCQCNFPFRGNLAMTSGALPPPDPQNRLVHGPAFGREPAKENDPRPWRSWRADADRLGVTDGRGPVAPARKWALHLGGDLTPFVAADGLLFVGSSDHLVRALDAASGQLKWQCATEGAIRAAPYFWHGRVLACDDEGWMHCLTADSGELVWKFRVAPSVDRIVSDGRLMSRWPAQFGAVVRGDTAYAAAGFAATDETWVVAVDASTGTLRWERNYLFGGRGHLAASEQSMFIPSWGAPAQMTLKDPAKSLPTKSAVMGIGRQSPLKGAVAVVDEAPITALSDFTVIQDVSKWTDYRECLPLVTEDTIYLRNGRTLTAEKRSALALNRGIFVAAKPAPRGKRPDTGTMWTAWKDVDMAAAIKVGDTIYSGSSGKIHATSAGDGRELWSLEVPGVVRDLAFNGGRLFVLCESGEVVCFEAVR